MAYICVLIAGQGDVSDDGTEMLGPTPKRRVIMPREASLNAKARMAGQHGDKSSSNPSGDMSQETIPETQGDSENTTSASQVTPPAFLNTSLPANIQNVHLNVGSAADPVLTGSHLYNPGNVLPSTTYQGFVSGIQGQSGQQTQAGSSQAPASLGTTSAQNPPPKKQGKKKTSATVTLQGAGTSPGSQDRLDIFMQHSQHQYAQLNAQMQALVGSISGIHSWLQMPAASMALAGHPGMAPRHNNAPPIYPSQVPMAYTPSGLCHSAVISGQLQPNQGNLTGSGSINVPSSQHTQSHTPSTQNITITPTQPLGTQLTNPTSTSSTSSASTATNTHLPASTQNTQPTVQNTCTQPAGSGSNTPLNGSATGGLQSANNQFTTQVGTSIAGVCGNGLPNSQQSGLAPVSLNGNVGNFGAVAGHNSGNSFNIQQNAPIPSCQGQQPYLSGMAPSQQAFNGFHSHMVHQPIPIYAANHTGVYGASMNHLAGTSLCPTMGTHYALQQQSQLGGASGFPGVVGNVGVGGTTYSANLVNTHNNSQPNWSHLAGGSRAATSVANSSLFHPGNAKHPNNYFNIHNLSTVPGIPPSSQHGNPMPQSHAFSLYKGGIPASAVNFQGGQNWLNYQHTLSGQQAPYTLGSSGLIQQQHRDGDRKKDGRMPVGWAVSLDIKEKIWKEDFVEFADLLDENSNAKQTIVVDCESGTTVDRQKKRKEISCIRDWDRAFATYLNIYTQKPEHLKHLFNLVTYGQTIKNMAEHGLDFLKYDEKFRKERASLVSEGEEPWSWDTFRQETYNNLQSDAIHKKLKLAPKKWYADTSSFTSFNTEVGKSGTSKVPFGFCFDFHTMGKTCLKEVCSYRHICPCGRGPHNLYACRSGGKPPSRGRGAGNRGRGRGKSANSAKE